MKVFSFSFQVSCSVNKRRVVYSSQSFLQFYNNYGSIKGTSVALFAGDTLLCTLYTMVNSELLRYMALLKL